MNEQNYFEGKIRDLIQRGSNASGMAFSGFLTAEESEIAAGICKSAGARYLLYGGYSDAERKILAVSDMEPEVLAMCFPLAILEIKTANPDAISNRDVLGSLMASGIKRELLGDIIVRDGVALVVVADHIKDYLIQNITSMGRNTVALNVASEDLKIPPPHFEEYRTTVASLRLDAVVASLCKCSRDQAVTLIEDGFVYLNHTQFFKKTKDITAGDCISIRRRGKWIIDNCSDVSKKGRIIIFARKYI